MFGNKWEPGVLESTHPLRDATLFRIIQNIIDIAKIHASLAECDKIFPIRPVNNGLLKSTHPLRDAIAKYRTHLCKKTTFRVSIFYFLIQTDEMNKKRAIFHLFWCESFREILST